MNVTCGRWFVPGQVGRQGVIHEAKYFAPDAVYRVEGTGRRDCVLEGRDAVFQGVRRCLDGFDRQCRREIRVAGIPSLDGNTVRTRGDAR